jgi:hypothetical protein
VDVAGEIADLPVVCHQRGGRVGQRVDQLRRVLVDPLDETLSSRWARASCIHPALSAAIGPGISAVVSSKAMISAQKKRIRLAIGHRPTMSCQPQKSAW